MPYKVGDTVKSRYGETGRVIEMYPEVTGDIDSPHLIYEYDGKPTVNVVILDADGKRHCAHWSFFTLQEASEITASSEQGIKVGDKVRHNLTGNRVATVTGIRRVQGYKWEGEITVYRLDFGESVKGPCGMEMNGGEYQREAFTLQETSGIKPKATDSIENYERTIIARTKQGKQAWRLVKGCEVRVRKAYTNGNSDPENWTYCVSWYADGQLVECENGVRLEQAAKALNDLPQWAEARKAA